MQYCILLLGFPGGGVAENLPANAGDTRDKASILESGRSPGVGHGNHSSILARIVPWTEGSGGLQPRWVTKSWTQLSTHTQSCSLGEGLTE